MNSRLPYNYYLCYCIRKNTNVSRSKNEVEILRLKLNLSIFNLFIIYHRSKYMIGAMETEIIAKTIINIFDTIFYETF